MAFVCHFWDATDGLAGPFTCFACVMHKFLILRAYIKSQAKIAFPRQQGTG